MENEVVYVSDYYIKTKGQCRKCKGIKYWNSYYRPDDHLCDDCASPIGMYYDLTDEQAQKIEHNIAYMVNDRVGDITEEYKYKYHLIEFVLQPMFDHTEFRVFGEKEVYTKKELIDKFKNMEVISIVPMNNQFVVKLRPRLQWRYRE